MRDFARRLLNISSRKRMASIAMPMRFASTFPFARPNEGPGPMKTLAWLSSADPPERFPPTDQALDEPSGLLAAGGDLSPARLLAAYRLGIFPWYSPGQPI